MAGTLYAIQGAPESGIYASTDDGATWSALRPFPLITSPWGDDREGLDGQTFFPYRAAVADGRLVVIDDYGIIMRTDDWGLSFVQESGLVRNDAVDPSWGTYLFPTHLRAVGDTFMVTGSSYWTAYPAGVNLHEEDSWTHMATPTGGYTFEVAYAGDTWFITSGASGGANAYSTDRGATWTAIASHPWDATGFNSYISRLVYHEAGAALYAAGRFGSPMQRSTDKGLTWTQLGASPSITMMGLAERGPGVIAFGNAEGDTTTALFQFTLDDGATWSSPVTVAGFDRPIGAMKYISSRDAWLAFEALTPYSQVGDTRHLVYLEADANGMPTGTAATAVFTPPNLATSYCERILVDAFYVDDPAPDPCCLLLQLFGSDKQTIEWEATTCQTYLGETGAAVPYLVDPENYGEQEVDFAECTASISQVAVALIDKAQTAGDQDSGWLTARADAIHGYRGRLLRFISETLGWVVIADGPCSSPRLEPDYASGSFQIRDTRETERKNRAFTEGGTTWVYPAGVEDGYGIYDAGGVPTYLVDPATPDTGTYYLASGSISGLAPALIADDDALEAQGDPQETDVLWTWPNVQFLWRAAGGSTWNVVDPSISLPFSAGAPQLIDGSVLYIGDYADAADLPSDGQNIDFALRYIGEPSKAVPFHLEGMTTGALLQDLYDGVYSPRDPVTDAIVSTGIRYDAAALALMTDPVRARLTEPVDDLRKWTEEHIYAPTGWVPALDSDGRISPVSQKAPPTAEDVTDTLTDAVTEPSPDWNAGARILNRIDFAYERHYIPTTPPENWTAPADGIYSRNVERNFTNADSIDRHGEEDVEFSGLLFAAVGNGDGAPLETTEEGHRHALNRHHYLMDRYKDGAPTVRVAVLRSHSALWRVGTFVSNTLSWIPDLTLGRRGADWIGQITAIADLDCAWRMVTVEKIEPKEAPPLPPSGAHPSVYVAGLIRPSPESNEVTVRYGADGYFEDYKWRMVATVTHTGAAGGPVIEDLDITASLDPVPPSTYVSNTTTESDWATGYTASLDPGHGVMYTVELFITIQILDLADALVDETTVWTAWDTDDLPS